MEALKLKSCLEQVVLVFKKIYFYVLSCFIKEFLVKAFVSRFIDLANLSLYSCSSNLEPVNHSERGVMSFKAGF